MKKIIFAILIIILIVSVGCSKVDNTNSEKQIADSIIKKLQTQDKLNLTEQEDKYLKNVVNKTMFKNELNGYEKSVYDQFVMTSPSKFLPLRD